MEDLFKKQEKVLADLDILLEELDSIYLELVELNEDMEKELNG